MQAVPNERLTNIPVMEEYKKFAASLLREEAVYFSGLVNGVPKLLCQVTCSTGTLVTGPNLPMG
jgi:hypothetical protein